MASRARSSSATSNPADARARLSAVVDIGVGDEDVVRETVLESWCWQEATLLYPRRHAREDSTVIASPKATSPAKNSGGL